MAAVASANPCESATNWSLICEATTGGTLSTFQVNVSVVLAPLSSVAFTVTVYGADLDADASMVPVITPVTASMFRPLGRPMAT